MTAPSNDTARPASATVGSFLGGPGRRLVVWVGIGTWSVIGAVILVSIAVAVLSVISSVVLPLVFAVVLAVLFRPVAARLEAHGLRSPLAAGAVVIGLVVLVAAVVALAVDGIVEQTSEIGEQIGSALDEAGFDEATSDDLSDAIASLSPTVTQGVAHAVVGGLGTLAGLAAGAILGVLIMYYLVKDSTQIRRAVIDIAPPAHRDLVDDLIHDACFVLRKYGQGRTTLSGIVALAVGVCRPPARAPAPAHARRGQLHRRLRPLHRSGRRRGSRRTRRTRGRWCASAFVMLLVVLGREPPARELRGAEGDGSHTRHPPTPRARRHGDRRHRRWTRRADARRPVHRDRDAVARHIAAHRRLRRPRRPRQAGRRHHHRSGDLALGTAADVTDRVLTEAQERGRHLAVIVADETGVIQSWSDGAAALFGYAAGEAVGRTVG
jgi:PAS domain-containing protein